MEVRVLTENTVYKRGFLGEHGLSLLIETENEKYLFDMGQSDVFLCNAKKLQIDLETLDGIVLSHGHYDHCGGMTYWEETQEIPEDRKREIPIYITEKALEDKYSENPKTGEMLFSGIQQEAKKWMRERANIIYMEKGCTQISEDAYLLSGIPYKTEFEPLPVRFWKEKMPGTDLEPDNMEDEQLLVIRREEGLCVFAGCAHAGIINCLNYVQSSFPGEHIYSLVAGMHLKGCSSQRLDSTIQSLREAELDVIVPLHCTGLTAIAAVQAAMPDVCVLAETGKKLSL